jgi:hypothetical protein
MPEGLEVYLLGRLLQRAGLAPRTHGKHLFLEGEDWTFGLSGRVAFDGTTLTKVNAGRVFGSVQPETPLDLGVDFATGTQEQLQAVVSNKFMGARKQLGSLLLDQSLIAGIGVAWGSEILAACGGLRPDVSAKALAMYGEDHVRDMDMVTCQEAVNGWFRNLYDARHMAVYGKGTPCMTGGRTWWL